MTTITMVVDIVFGLVTGFIGILFAQAIIYCYQLKLISLVGCAKKIN